MKSREMEEEDSPDEREESDGGVKEEQRQWLTCSANRQAHDVDKLMLTQIIPADGKSD